MDTNLCSVFSKSEKVVLSSLVTPPLAVLRMVLGNANIIEDPDAVVQSEISSVERFSFDLEWLENLSINDEVFDDYSSAYSELQSDILKESSDLDISEYSPWVWYDSGSQFSEKSISDDCPSHSFHLSRQFSEEFYRSTYALEHSPFLEEHNIPDEISLELKEEDGECYQMLRRRERSYNGNARIAELLLGSDLLKCGVDVNAISRVLL